MTTNPKSPAAPEKDENVPIDPDSSMRSCPDYPNPKLIREMLEEYMGHRDNKWNRNLFYLRVGLPFLSIVRGRGWRARRERILQRESKHRSRRLVMACAKGVSTLMEKIPKNESFSGTYYPVPVRVGTTPHEFCKGAVGSPEESD